MTLKEIKLNPYYLFNHKNLGQRRIHFIDNFLTYLRDVNEQNYTVIYFVIVCRA